MAASIALLTGIYNPYTDHATVAQSGKATTVSRVRLSLVDQQILSSNCQHGIHKEWTLAA